MATIYSGFLKQCQKSPDQTAFIEAKQQLSYAQFKQWVEILASHLSQYRCQRIACALDRGIDAAICIYAISLAGVCYLPLDIKNPAERLRFIVEDADVQLIIGQGPAPDWCAHPAQWLDIQRLLNTAAKPFTPRHPATESIAAILYTSGSTGKPKGVALSHQAMVNFAQWAANTFQISTTDRIASLAPFHFDLSIFDLFSSLSSGATVHFIPSSFTLAPSRLSAWLQEHRISTWYTVPSLLSFLALKGALDSTPLPDLKQILFAGEVFPTPHLIKLSQLLADVKLYNLYGPTETNVCCYWPVDRTRLKIDQDIPIGLPACNASLSINQETGELNVASANNFSGYWQKGQLQNNNKTYRTGDKVSLNDQAEYCYHGRLDRMLKCAGYRVEPAEIERVIKQLPGVNNCAVTGIKDPTSGQRPAAAMVLNETHQLSELIKLIRLNLPTYMQPVKYITVSSLPCLSNGKIDYLQIQELF